MKKSPRMIVAVTGGTGFIGRHLAQRLVADGHEVFLLARGTNGREGAILNRPYTTFVASDLSNRDDLAAAFAGCEVVAHCAGINRELGNQTYRQVHIEGTRNVVEAARQAGVKKIVLMSFLRARPDCGSAYHESKWRAEEIVRSSGLDYTILKTGGVYGRGDHLLDHLARSILTIQIGRGHV